MKKSLLVFSLLAIVCLALAGCAPAAVPLTISQIPWPDDEVTSYTIEDQEGNTMGNCELTVDKDGDTYILTDHSELTIEGTEVTSDTTITVDATDLKPISGTETWVIDEQTIEIATTYSEGQVAITATVDGEEQSAVLDIPDDAYDNEEVLFLLRAITFEVGYSATYTNVVPAAGLTPEATITVISEEVVNVPFGSFNCYKLELSVLGTTQYLWYGADSPHYLVKAEVEGIAMLLTSVTVLTIP